MVQVFRFFNGIREKPAFYTKQTSGLALPATHWTRFGVSIPKLAHLGIGCPADVRHVNPQPELARS